MNAVKTITLAYTGASGMPYGVRLLELLLASGNRVYLLYSQPAQMVTVTTRQFAIAKMTSTAVSKTQMIVRRIPTWLAPPLGFGRPYARMSRVSSPSPG